MVLTLGKFPALEVCYKIFSGLSTTVGGFGFVCDLVFILHEARYFTQQIERLKALGLLLEG